MRREHPRLWRDLPAVGQAGGGDAGPARSCPRWSRNITAGDRRAHRPAARPQDHGDRALPRRTPAWSSRSSARSGRRELQLMVTFGFVFGFLLGVPVAIIDHWFGHLVAAAADRRGRRLDHQQARDVADLRAAASPGGSSGIKAHGLFLRRQDEAAEVYARNIAEEVITLERIGDFLMNGPRGDRTRADARASPPAGHRRRGRAAAAGDPGGGGRPAASTRSATRSRWRRSAAPSTRSATPSSAASRR